MKTANRRRSLAPVRQACEVHSIQILEQRTLLAAPQNLKVVQELPFSSTLQLSINDPEFPQSAYVSVEDRYTGQQLLASTIQFPTGLGDRFANLPLPTTAVPGHRKVTLRVASSQSFFYNDFASIDVDVKFSPLSASISGNRVTINWPSYSGATGYDIWINDVSKGIRQVVRDQNLSSESYSGSFSEGTFTAWVRAKTPNGILTAWSEPVSFTMSGPARMISPSGLVQNGVADETFRWSKHRDATGYQLWVNNNDTNTRVIYEQNLPASETSFVANFDLNPASYSAWVRAKLGNESFGAWSPASTFQIRPRTTLLDAPNVSFSSTTTTIFWPAVSNAANYDLWIDDVTNKVSQYIRDQSLATNFYMILQNSGTYTAWIRPKNAGGTYTSGWSQPVTWTVSGSPVFKSSAVSYVERTQLDEITWSQFKDALRYELWVQNDTTGTRVIHEPNLSRSVSSFIPSTPLVPASYTAWVRARLAGDRLTNWSAPAKFTVTPSTLRILTGITFSQSTFDNTPTFSWDTARIASPVYDLSIYDESEPATPVYVRNGLQSNSFTLDMPLAAGEYSVSVIARNALGQQTPVQPLRPRFLVGFTNQMNFGVRQTTTLSLSFYGSAASLGGRFGASWLDVKLVNSSGETVYENSQVTSNDLQLPNSLSGSGSLRVWLRAVRAEGTTTFSSEWLTSPFPVIVRNDTEESGLRSSLLDAIEFETLSGLSKIRNQTNEIAECASIDAECASIDVDGTSSMEEEAQTQFVRIDQTQIENASTKKTYSTHDEADLADFFACSTSPWQAE